YYFVTREEFQRLLDGGAFLEHVDFEWGQSSGTLWSEIGRIRAAGRAPLLDLETEGALAVKREIDDCVTIFVKAPSFAELERGQRRAAGRSRSGSSARSTSWSRRTNSTSSSSTTTLSERRTSFWASSNGSCRPQVACPPHDPSPHR